MAPRGAVLLVLALTDGMEVVGVRRRENDRSNIARNGRDLCGIIATGEIFSSGGGDCRMSSQYTRRA